MAFHLIGLGLNLNSLTQEAIHAIEGSRYLYLEGYTVDFPYNIDQLDKKFGRLVKVLDRGEVENESILEKAKHDDVALLVYGDSLSATTHTQLILSCKQQGIPYSVYHNASIMNAIANTGLQLYKFGKTASMPRWQKNYEPTSYINLYKDNEGVKAHTLILTDIGLELESALDQLERTFNIEGLEFSKKIIVISHAGTATQKIYFDTIPNLKRVSVQKPFCIIIPSDLHFVEEEALNAFKE